MLIGQRGHLRSRAIVTCSHCRDSPTKAWRVLVPRLWPTSRGGTAGRQSVQDTRAAADHPVELYWQGWLWPCQATHLLVELAASTNQAIHGFFREAYFGNQDRPPAWSQAARARGSSCSFRRGRGPAMRPLEFGRATTCRSLGKTVTTG